MTMRIYIDGQNFMYKAAEILIEAGRIQDKSDLTKIDIRGIMERIFGTDIEIVYYGAKVKVRRDLGDDIRTKTTRFSDVSRRIRNTLNDQGITFNESGKLKVRDSDVCHNCHHQDLRLQEKGVDVGIAVAMVADALKQEVMNQVVVSSDTDLLPAIQVARIAGASVTYVGFSDKTTKAIVAKTDKTEIIRNQEVIDAFDKLNPPTLPIN